MGAQRVLQAAGLIAILVATATTARADGKKLHERIAIIDLGPGDDTIRRRLGAGAAAAGFELVLGDGVEDALAGQGGDDDTVQLAAALGDAQRAFGALDCKAAVTAAATAGGIAAARQAAGMQVPELAKAWALQLLCADRTGDVTAAMVAASRLRAAGGSADVPAAIMAKYPDVDVVAGVDLVPLEITSDAPGAEIWVDLQRVGPAPAKITVPAGDHVIAAAVGTRRGWAAGTAVRTQTQLTVPTKDHAGPWSEVAARVASWKGAVPAPAELGFVLAKVRARVALIRRGDTVEAWGRIGLKEAPHRLGGDDASAPLADAGKLIELVVDRVHTWNDRAPDPDTPLLVDDPKQRLGIGGKRRDEPTKWWVYASLAGAVLAGAVIIYAHDAGTDRQRVELHYP